MARERTLKVIIAGDADKLNKELKKANTHLAGLGRQSSITSRVTSAGMTAIGGAAVAGLGYAVKSAMDFEKQLSALGAVSDATGAQMEAFRKQAMKAGRDTAFSANEAALAQTELAKGGLSVANIMKGGLNSALALAAAGELELGDAASITANAMNLFAIRGKDSTKVADALASAANATTADVADFGMALKQGGAVAKSAGLSFEQTVVALEALASSGVKNADAGTSLKTALIQLIKPTNNQAKEAERMGLKFIDAAGNMKSLGDISAMLRDKLGEQTRTQRTATLATIAGTDGVRTLTALYDAGPAKLAKWEHGVRETGSAAEVARKKQDNLAGAVEQLKGSAETLAISVGTELIPELTKGAQKVTKFVNEMQDGTGQGGKFVRVLKDIWSEVKPVVLWIGRATKTVGEFAAEHPAVAKLAGAIIGLGVAVKTLRFISAATGFTHLLSAGRVAAKGLRRILASGGTAAGEAAAANAASGFGSKSAKFTTAGRKAGRLVGKGLAVGAVIGAAAAASDALDEVIGQIRKRFGEMAGDAANQAIKGPLGTLENLIGRDITPGAGDLLKLLPGNATGGIIPGSGNRDTVPRMLTPGEFVIRKQVVEKFGPTFFAGLNEGMGGNAHVRGMSSGGIVRRANELDAMHLPYLWGGGHAGRGINRAGMDCSGAVSYALGVSPRVSGAFMGFGQPGPGAPMDTKVYANAKHVFAVFNGQGWGTSAENPGGGPGWLSYSHRPGFTIRHLNDASSKGTNATVGDTQEEVEAGKERRIARQEKSGSRLVNKIAAAGLKGAGALSRGAASLAGSIGAADTAYGLKERFFGQVIGGQAGKYGDEDLGTAGGRKARITELVALKRMRTDELREMKKRASALRGLIGKYEKTVSQLQKARGKARGAKRAKMSERIKAFVSRLSEYKAELLALGESIESTKLDIGDLQKDIQDVATTPDTPVDAPEAGPTPGERAADLTGLIDLKERAGLIDPGTAQQQKIDVISAAIQGKFGATTEREQLQLLGDLKEAQDAGVQAVEDNTSALRDLIKSIDDNTNFAKSVMATENATLLKGIADLISGEIGGYGIAGRALMPGTAGVRARY